MSTLAVAACAFLGLFAVGLGFMLRIMIRDKIGILRPYPEEIEAIRRRLEDADHGR